MALARSRSRFVDEAVVAYACEHTSPPDRAAARAPGGDP